MRLMAVPFRMYSILSFPNGHASSAWPAAHRANSQKLIVRRVRVHACIHVGGRATFHGVDSLPQRRLAMSHFRKTSHLADATCESILCGTRRRANR